MRALLLASLLAAPAGAVRPITPPAPEFAPGAAWINAKPLSLAMMRGRKAVLVAFLNPAKIRSLRLLPALKSWFDRYALSQLMVIGVVTPDLEAQKDAAWLRAEVKRLGVEFPIVLDADRRLWKAYANDGWPALYLIDGRGRLVFDRLGEGDYDEFEREIRSALGDLAPKLPEAVEFPEPKTANCGRATADVAMGERAKKPALALDGPSPPPRQMLVQAREGELASRGKWKLEPDGMSLAQANPDSDAFVRVVYAAPQALAVLTAPPGETQRFFVKRDDQWLYEGTAGDDVRYDDDGRSYVPVRASRLYDLARDPEGRTHELIVIPEKKGGGIFGFSFADRCTLTKLP